MSFAIVFSGQGMQHPEMLTWLVEDDIVRRTCCLLGVDDWRGRLSDKAWASANSSAQVLLTGLGLAAWHQLASDLPDPACVAGYSVGELAAFSAAGVFDAHEALDLACQRALAMNRCAARAPGGLLAVTGLSTDAIDALCMETGLELAIRIGMGSVVLGGTDAMIAEGESRVESFGARSTRLSVGVASHTHWMRQAAEEFAQVLTRTPLQRPQGVLFSNLGGRVQHAAQAGSALAAQIANTVRWDECMDDIHARAPSCVLEIGPGQALARMWNQRHPDIPARSCDDFRSGAAAKRWIGMSHSM
jgi:[acyl-carrier-protein] S-malonyltransferase